MSLGLHYCRGCRRDLRLRDRIDRFLAARANLSYSAAQLAVSLGMTAPTARRNLAALKREGKVNLSAMNDRTWFSVDPFKVQEGNDPEFKVICCGGRGFTDRALVDEYLRHLPAGTLVIHGDQRGADKIAGEVAKERGLAVKPYPADWDRHGKAAGPIRNSQMLRENPDVSLVIAFPGGDGTSDMVKKADRARVTVVEASWADLKRRLERKK